MWEHQNTATALMVCHWWHVGVQDWYQSLHPLSKNHYSHLGDRRMITQFLGKIIKSPVSTLFLLTWVALLRASFMSQRQDPLLRCETACHGPGGCQSSLLQHVHGISRTQVNQIQECRHSVSRWRQNIINGTDWVFSETLPETIRRNIHSNFTEVGRDVLKSRIIWKCLIK